MMTFRKFVRAAAALAVLAGVTTAGLQAANAAPNGSRFDGRYAKVAVINARIQNQASRVRLGRAAGRLTYVEARKARFELSHIRGFKARYLRDGSLSHREARHLDRLLDSNARRLRIFSASGKKSRPFWRPGRHTLSRLNGFR